MPSRPKDWQKIINAEAEVCHWIAPDGTRHPCTDEENAEVRRELLIMRTTSDKRRQQRIEERESSAPWDAPSMKQRRNANGKPSPKRRRRAATRAVCQRPDGRLPR